ncbi:hypothetical protein [Anaerosinus massiliensis]|uniref:hypothetical protein n=1 Tax=Massilibacillus massiliensis TaxID=1806837 RepID=UPI000DA614FC|nr:hypothetical protein [Massilibacillus massiliensis]
MAKLNNHIEIISASQGKTEYAALYSALTDLIPSLPYLPIILASGQMAYAQLDEVGKPYGTCGRIFRIADNKWWQICSESIAILNLSYSLNMGFNDGGSFPGKSYTLGSFHTDVPQILTLEFYYNYRANEGRSGNVGVRVVIDNNVIVSFEENAGANAHTFSKTINFNLGAGNHTVLFQGYKPKWHGMLNCNGYLRIKNR